MTTKSDLFFCAIEICMTHPGELCQVFNTMQPIIILENWEQPGNVKVLTPLGVSQLWGRTRVLTERFMTSEFTDDD